MTPQEVETAARRRYNAETDNFWSQDEIFKMIWEGEVQLCQEAMCAVDKNTSVSTVASTQSYSLPTNTIGLKRVEYDGQKLKNISLREDDVLTLENSTTTSTGTPLYYWEWNDLIYLRPIPDQVKVLTMYRYIIPTLYTTSSTALTVPLRYHKDLVNFVVAQMAYKDSQDNIGDRYLARWDRAVLDAKRYEKQRRRGDAFAVTKDENDYVETIIGLL